MPMSPTAEPTSAEAAAEATELDRLLGDGEIVLLALKPSSWFVPLVSLPVLATAGVVAAAAAVGEALLDAPGLHAQTVEMVCLAAACLRVMIAAFQWLGRLYVLTNVRVLQLQGILRTHIIDCPLRQLQPPRLSVSPLERPLGLGSLLFRRRAEESDHSSWVHLAGPQEVEQAIREAMSRLS